MIRVHVICEGQTEEMFVNEVLSTPFQARNIWLTPSLVGKPGHKGGNFKFERLLFDLKLRLLNDREAYCTTFFDFYGLPEGFPGKEEASKKNGGAAKAACLLKALNQRLEQELGPEALRRFLPYIQMYEFEGLLFSHPEKLALGIDQKALAAPFQKIRDDFDTPEDINNSSATAPSKRIEKLYPGYDKPLHGSLAAMEIGLSALRKECALFNAWLEAIESLAP